MYLSAHHSINFADTILKTVHFHFSQTETSFITPVPPLLLPDEEHGMIQEHWQTVNADGRFFNGTVLAGMQIKLENVPSIQISTSDYAHYLYSNANPAATPCRIIYCAAIIITSDNHVLVGEMASSTSAPGRLQFVGGNIELAPDGTVSGEACCKREITEEVGFLFLDKTQEFRPLCIKTGGKADHIGIYYLLRLTITADKAKSAFKDHLAALAAREEMPELVKIHLIELTDVSIKRFCADHDEQLVDYLSPLLTSHLDELLQH
ncbi:hypothetical protein CTT39_02415 [Agrobacterium rosae]|nr:hypothetical protein CTT39_02415 [Agrobacterium rosae]